MYIVEIVNIIISKNRIFGFSVFFGFLNTDVGFAFGYRLGSTRDCKLQSLPVSVIELSEVELRPVTTLLNHTQRY